MKTGKIVLWIVVAVFALISVNGFSESSSDPNTGNLVRALGKVQGTVFGVAAAWLAVAFLLGGRARDADENQDGDQRSGCEDFREQPALLAVANAIERNDEYAIRAAVKNVPDLQAAGREGKTLLYFAVEEALERPQLVKSVATLLSCGADPNYNNGKLYSFAMSRGSTGDVHLLRTLLDAGGNPNGTDYLGKPIICELLSSPYSEGDRRDRLRLLQTAVPTSTPPGRTGITHFSWISRYWVISSPWPTLTRSIFSSEAPISTAPATIRLWSRCSQNSGEHGQPKAKPSRPNTTSFAIGSGSMARCWMIPRGTGHR